MSRNHYPYDQNKHSVAWSLSSQSEQAQYHMTTIQPIRTSTLSCDHYPASQNKHNVTSPLSTNQNMHNVIWPISSQLEQAHCHMTTIHLVRTTTMSHGHYPANQKKHNVTWPLSSQSDKHHITWRNIQTIRITKLPNDCYPAKQNKHNVTCFIVLYSFISYINKDIYAQCHMRTTFLSEQGQFHMTVPNQSEAVEDL